MAQLEEEEYFWICDQCDHINPETQWPCASCQYPNCSPQHADVTGKNSFVCDLLQEEVILPVEIKIWHCSRCTKENDESLTHCEICMAKRNSNVHEVQKAEKKKNNLLNTSGCSIETDLILTKEEIGKLSSPAPEKKEKIHLKEDLEQNFVGAKVIRSFNQITGVLFRVWAPNATRVFVVGDWNHWKVDADAMVKETNPEYWQSFIPEARPKQQYKYIVLFKDGKEVKSEYRNDPRGEIVRKNNEIYDQDAFVWSDQHYNPPSMRELVLYELHVGTHSWNACSKKIKHFKQIGTFKDIEKQLSYFVELGINGLALMPIGQDIHSAPGNCWGYDPISLFSIHTDYGTPDDLKSLINSAHLLGISVFFDYVPNHLSSRNILGNFDGPADIYFPSDRKKKVTPWGPRPDFSKPQVRAYIIDAAANLLSNYHFDGIRVDSTGNIRNYTENNTPIIDPHGWTLLQELNDYIHSNFPGKITIAEDLNDPGGVVNLGGNGFDLQWDGMFFGNLLQTIINISDKGRKMNLVAEGIMNYKLNSEAAGRVIYTESHDTVPSDRQGRIPAAILRGNQSHWAPCKEVEESFYSFKRTSLALSVLMTSVGVPMLLQGQEIFETCAPAWPMGPVVDRSRLDRPTGQNFFDLTRELCYLRRNYDNHSAGLTGNHTRVFHINNNNHKVIAYHRWNVGGPGDDVIVIANFSNTQFSNYKIGLPRSGTWNLRFNTDATQFGHHSQGFPTKISVEAEPSPRDGYPFSASISFSSYAALIYSQDSMATITIKASYNTTWGDRLAVVGSSPTLGSWNVSKAMLMATGTADIPFPLWQTLKIPVSVGKLERFKIVLLRKGQPGGVYFPNAREILTPHFQSGPGWEFFPSKSTNYEFNCPDVSFGQIV